jgi:hypothetical protein
MSSSSSSIFGVPSELNSAIASPKHPQSSLSSSAALGEYLLPDKAME